TRSHPSPTRRSSDLNQTSLFEPLAVYSETWPTSGMTHNGTAYELPTSEHHTDGTGSSSLLPTPTVGNQRESGTCRDFGGDLTHALTCNCKLLPTPKAGDGEMHTPSTSGRPVEKSTHLGTIAMLQAGNLDHRRSGATTSQPSGVGSEPLDG